MTFDVAQVRAQFPALKSDAVFFDNPGGTQVAERVVERMSDYLLRTNANHGGGFKTSIESDAVVHEAHKAVADFLGAARPEEIVFGANMTTLTFMLSRALGRRLGPGDEIVVTRLDHDANISPWLQMAEDRGVTVRWVDLRPQDCTLVMKDFEEQITERTKLVACGYASNAVGTINDVKTVVRLAHEVGAMAYIDAVHYAPHGPIDVRELDCDFLACSTYKFFGPHMGVLYAKREHLARLQPYKLRANTNIVPQRWEWGTLNHELLAGVSACIDYFADLGKRTSGDSDANYSTGGNSHVEAVAPGCRAERSSAITRRGGIISAYRAIHSHERELMQRMLSGLSEIRGVRLYGISDPARIDSRCPTFAVRIPGHSPLELATSLGNQGIFTWDGNYYALNLTERLGVEQDGGFLRVGFVHYNTEEEVDRVLSALLDLR